MVDDVGENEKLFLWWLVKIRVSKKAEYS